MSDQTTYSLDLTILILCLNEEKSIADCVRKARGFLERNAIHGEVLVADNNSRDRSATLAEEAGARVILCSDKGYGNAINAGIEAALGRFIILGDGDGEHDLGSLELFWQKLQNGYDFVIGNRFLSGFGLGGRSFPHRSAFSPAGSASPPPPPVGLGRRSFLHRLGNFLLSGVGRLFFRSPVGDFHCGLRAFKTHSVRRLSLQCPGMELASEMIIKATQKNMRITEVPVTLHPATDPDRLSHVRVWRDGWRHLRLLLIFSPRWLFLYPGCILFAAGLFIMVETSIDFGNRFGAYAMIFSSAFVICGLQAIIFSLLARIFCETIGLADEMQYLPYLQKHHSLEIGLTVGFALILLGVAGSIWSVFVWTQTAGVDLQLRLQVAIPSVTLLVAGVQIVFSSFFLSLLGTQKAVWSR